MRKLAAILMMLICFNGSALSKDESLENLIFGNPSGTEVLNICSKFHNKNLNIANEGNSLSCYTSILTTFYTVIGANSISWNFDANCFYDANNLGLLTRKIIVSEIIDYIMVNKNIRDSSLSLIISKMIIEKYKLPASCKELNK